MEKLGHYLINLQPFILPEYRLQEEYAEEGCKDEKNTVILCSHASNPVDIRFARRYKVSQA